MAIKFKIILLVITIYLLVRPVSLAQQVQGRVVDKFDQQPLPGATVLLIDQIDTTKIIGSTADENGNFNILVQQAGRKILRVEYAAYKTFNRELTVTDSVLNIGQILMEPATFILETAIIKGKQNLAQQKGDTTEYNANAFKTSPDATAQDLVGKMPGITNENGTIKAQGETVNKVLVDGKEFFGDDATIALRNLPAEIIDKVQVYDRLNDQSQFTGFDDGNTVKTINIVTKAGRNNGTFGRVFGGYGTDGRYTAGGSLNSFNGNRRITLLGLANNINQQNFAAQDLTGVSSGSSGQRGGGGAAGGRGSQGGAANFNVGQQGGISTTQSIGLNYSDNFGDKIKLTGSYFLNKSENLNVNSRKRNYLLNNAEQVYNESNNALSKNLNHRLNARLEYSIDSNNTILLTPRLTVQNMSSNSILYGQNTFSDSMLLSRTEVVNSNSNLAYNFANNLLFRHKFSKTGRTFSLDLNTNISNRNGKGSLQSENHYYTPIDSISLINQLSDNKGNGNTIGSNFIYTEPLSKKSILQLNYSPSFTNNFSNRQTNAYDEMRGEYALLVPRLSSRFINEITNHRGGLGYRLKGGKYNFMSALNYQQVTLSGKQNFPINYTIIKNFRSLLPTAMLNYKFTKTKNLRLNYRTSTNAPSINQLQTFIDNSNPLLLTAGNPELSQEYSHNLNFRYSSTRSSAASAFLLYFNGTFTNNYITNHVTIAGENSIIGDSIILNKGSQLSRPVNINGYSNLNAFTSYGIPVEKIKTNLNLNAGFGFSKIPGVINDVLNKNFNYNINYGAVLASNISERLDFTLSYSGYYNIIEYSLQQKQNNDYYYHIASFKFNWMPWKGLVIYSDLTNTIYSGLGPSFDRRFVLWNPALAYKFLKNNAGELKISSFDILNQNNSISRNATAAYIEDNRTQVLRRYFMLTFSYTFRNFKSQQKNDE